MSIGITLLKSVCPAFKGFHQNHDISLMWADCVAIGDEHLKSHSNVPQL